MVRADPGWKEDGRGTENHAGSPYAVQGIHLLHEGRRQNPVEADIRQRLPEDGRKSCRGKEAV